MTYYNYAVGENNSVHLDSRMLNRVSAYSNKLTNARGDDAPLYISIPVLHGKQPAILAGYPSASMRRYSLLGFGRAFPITSKQKDFVNLPVKDGWVVVLMMSEARHGGENRPQIDHK